MKKKIKKFIFPGTAIIASAFFSIVFVIGGILGYFMTEKFSKKYVKTGKVNIMEFNMGKWNLHLHHWVLGGLMMLWLHLLGIISTFPVIVIGALGGLIFHDIHTDKEWHKVIYKK